MEEKIAFFTELFKLDEDDEEIEDPEDAAVILRQFKPPCKLPQPEERARNTLVQLPDDSLKEASSPIQSPPKLVPKSSVGKRPSQRRSVDKQPPTKAASEKKGKRKRDQPLELLPDSQQIFKGLTFYFIPNNDISPARRFRIRKALERGALWVREWQTYVTHIIADKSLTYKDIISFLKLSQEGVTLVNEDYPADCIGYRMVLNPDQIIYHVEGYEPPKKTENSSSSASSDGSAISVNVISESGEPPVSHVVSPEMAVKLSEASPQRNIPAPGREGTGGKTSSASKTGKMLDAPAEKSRDALDEAIEELTAFKDLPLDCDEDLEPIEIVADETDKEQSENERSGARSKRTKHDQPWQQNFSCMQKHDGKDKSQNPNSRTIEILQQMLEYYDRTNDHWRTIAYRKAISALRKHHSKVITKEEASRIPFIGPRLAAKIEEIVLTDRLKRLDNTSLEPNDLILQKFLGIYGVGLAQATKWINQGHRTLSDLVSKAQLSKNQLIGIQHYDDFQTRIARQEVESHGEFLRTVIHRVDPTIQVTIGGSYRRGASDSGDIDFIITKPNCSIRALHAIIFDTILPILQQRGYVKASLAVSSKDDGSKWHGAATLPDFGPVWRRVDMLLVPWDEMGAALIYFTGNDIFNRSMRLLARKKGMRLNQHGLWRDAMGGARSGGGRSTQGTLVEGKTEERIFELLGVPYRPPEHRIC